MTQAELELVAREIRARSLHSSWDELLKFSRDTVGSLVDAYQALLRSAAKSDKISPSSLDDVQKVMRGKLATVLTLLTSEARVAKWELEILTENNRAGTQRVEDSRFEEN